MRILRAFLCAFLGIIPGCAGVDVLTNRNDNHRSGVNPQETILTQKSVHTNFGKLWTLYSDAKVMGQPLYVSNLVVPANLAIGATAKAGCAAGCNAVIFASMKGTVYAYMADERPAVVTSLNQANPTLIWATYLSYGQACKCAATGPQNGSADFDMWAVDDPWWGILSTPAIDRASNSLYAVDWTNDGQYRVYNLDLRSGAIKNGPVTVQGSVNGVSFIQTTPKWTQVRKQRAGLLLAGGSLYVGFGGDNDQEMSGWLFVYDAATLALKTVWSPDPGQGNGGIWQSGQGLAADNSGNIYLQTANGGFVPGKPLFGDALLRLTLGAGGLTVADYFAPCNQAFLSACDLDYGSSGPVLFDDFVVGGGKYGEIYFMRANNLGKYSPGPRLPAAGACDAIPDPSPGTDLVGGLPAKPANTCSDGAQVLQTWHATMGHIHGAPVLWKGPNGKSWLYVMGEGDHLKAFPFDGTKFDVNVADVKLSQWLPGNPEPPPCGGPVMHWMPGGIISVSSNGANPGGGIVWAIVPANGDANSYRGVKGMLLALDAENVHNELWRSQGAGAAAADNKDSFGLLARFVPPTVANGKVFVATAGDKEPIYRWCNGNRPTMAQQAQNYYIAVYGLKQ